MIRAIVLTLAAMAMAASGAWGATSAKPAARATTHTGTAKPKPAASHPAARPRAAVSATAAAPAMRDEGVAVGSDVAAAGVAVSEYPRDMEIKGDAVHVRSGPGMYYYDVALVNEATRVRVESAENGWSAITAPAKWSVAALVKKEDVKSDAALSKSGTVTATMARVYAKDPKSDRTWAVIGQLPADAKVTIKGEEGPYYTVAMPEGATVYVKDEFLEPVAKNSGGSGSGLSAKLPEIKPMELDPQTPAYEKAAGQLRAELAKPLAERKFSPELVDAMRDVAEKAKAEYLSDAASQGLAQIEFQKALQQGLEKQKADRESLAAKLGEIKDVEAKEQAKREAETREKGSIIQPDFTGVLRKMTATMGYAYRLESDDGRYVCLLNGDAKQLDQLLGLKVRVWGVKKNRSDLNIWVIDASKVEAVTASGR
jgi:uncharacterized protein YgiM (DUF1202 family)